MYSNERFMNVHRQSRSHLRQSS